MDRSAQRSLVKDSCRLRSLTNDPQKTLGAIHTTIVIATNTLYDLLGSDPDHRYYNSLQEEAAAIFQTEQDWVEPSSLAKLSYADSTLRETLRERPCARAQCSQERVLREVVRKEGLHLPNGHHVPQGAWLGVPAVSLHHDERFYPNPDEYDPFRFARAVTEPSPTRDAQAGKPSKYQKLQGLSTTSDIYLAFGYGRHSW